jgi:hypothetical protein
MTRILLIGNSHAAAFKHAWDRMAPEYPQLDITFFVLPGVEFAKLRLNHKRRVFGALSGHDLSADALARLRKFHGQPTISLDGFDHILVVGKQHGMLELLSMLTSHDVDVLRETGAPQRLSEAAFNSFRAEIAQSYSPEMAWLVLRGFPVTFHAMPRYSEHSTDAPDTMKWEHDIAAPLIRQDAGVAEAMDGLAADYAKVLAEAGLTFLQQPASTLAPCGFTKAEYAQDAFGILGNGIARDYLHMNPAYGEACLTAFLEHHGLAKQAA